MEKTRRYKLMRCDDMQIIGDVEIKDSDIQFVGKIRYMKIGMLMLVAMLIGVSIFFVVKHTFTVSRLNMQTEASINKVTHERDSCMSEIMEMERCDNFSIVCAEVFCSADCEAITHDRLWEFIQECNPWYPDIIMMQAVMESGCGRSAVGKRCNNLFGMTKPTARKLRCDINRKNKKEKYAEYQNWKTSVIDRILWEKWVFRDKKGKPTIDEYLSAIEKVYNTETPGYAQNIHKQAAKYR